MLVYFDIYVFKHKWEDVSKCVLQKYPNERQPDIASSDIVSKKLNLNDNKLYITNIKTAINPMLSFISFPIYCKHVYAIENIIIDNNAKTMILKTKNYNLNQYITLKERCNYIKIDENNTRVEYKAIINVDTPIYKNYIENFLLTRYKDGVLIGRSIINDILHK